MIDRDRFRDALSGWASGVTIVACRTESGVVATTVSAFMSLSLDPPLVLVGIGPNATVRPFLQPAVSFGISVLGARQRRLAMVFADPYPAGVDPFPEDGAPLIEGSVLGLECVVESAETGGDHAIVIAGVSDVRIQPGSAPLIRYNRKYHALGD